MTAKVENPLEYRFEIAQKVAREAGALALDYFNRRQELVIETKRDLQDVVSVADRHVETEIRQRLEAMFPEDGALGEEFGHKPGSSGYTWVIDPIDGTAPFVNGLTSWCVSIALLAEGDPVIGVVRVPCNDETFAAFAEGGAFLNGVRLTLDAKRTLQNGLTGIGGNSHVPPKQVGQTIASLLAVGGNYIRTGSGAQMLAQVAAGRLVGYFEQHMHAWDCLAGYCLVKEAGGEVQRFPVEGDGLLKGAPVLAAGPGAFQDLKELTDSVIQNTA